MKLIVKIYPKKYLQVFFSLLIQMDKMVIYPSFYSVGGAELFKFYS